MFAGSFAGPTGMSACFCGSVVVSTTAEATAVSLYCWSDRCQELREVDALTASDLLDKLAAGRPARLRRVAE